MTKLFFFLSLLAFASPAFAAGGGSSTVGPANPADVLCNKVGGKVTTLTGADGGQAGFCVLGQSAIIDDWTLWRELNNERTEAVAAFFSGRRMVTFHSDTIGMSNYAAENCENFGGRHVLYRTEEGDELGVCAFGDRSAIEEWTLFFGPREARNAELVKVLKK